MVQSPESSGFAREDDAWFSHDAAGKRLQWIVLDVLFKCPESHIKSHFCFAGVIFVVTRGSDQMYDCVNVKNTTRREKYTDKHTNETYYCITYWLEFSHTVI